VTECKTEGCTSKTRGEAFDVCWVCWKKDRIAEQKKAYYEKNRDRIAEQKKAYYEKNRDKRKAYYEKNKDKIAEQQKAYREKNRDRIAEQKKAYREETFCKVRGWTPPIRKSRGGDRDEIKKPQE
jgi:phage-related minor tail protein